MLARIDCPPAGHTLLARSAGTGAHERWLRREVHTVTAHFGGSIPQESGEPLELSHDLYEPTTATGSLTASAEDATVAYTGDTVIAVGSVLNAAATVAQADDGTPGDITRSQVRFDVKQDGVVLATATVPVPETGLVSASFPDLPVGVYTVETALLGAGFFAATPASVLVAVYDPDGGFVTGGGWIESPAGACQLTAVCQGATGRANFGFVSKYQKGASTPSGQTQFQFKAGGLNFHSSSYEWLVVSGARAQYKGSGTINGAGDYGFMLTAIDGQVSGGGGSDKFRIKIWDKATGTVVYDNQLGDADDTDPTTVIQGGSIIIHKG